MNKKFLVLLPALALMLTACPEGESVSSTSSSGNSGDVNDSTGSSEGGDSSSVTPVDPIDLEKAQAIANLQALSNPAVEANVTLNNGEKSNIYRTVGVIGEELGYSAVYQVSDAGEELYLEELYVKEPETGYLASEFLGIDNTIQYSRYSLTGSNEPLMFDDVIYAPFSGIDDNSSIWHTETKTLEVVVMLALDGFEAASLIFMPVFTPTRVNIVFDEELNPVAMAATLTEGEITSTLEGRFVNGDDVIATIERVQTIPMGEGKEPLTEMISALHDANNYTISYGNTTSGFNILVDKEKGVVEQFYEEGAIAQQSGTFRVNDSEFVRFKGVEADGTTVTTSTPNLTGDPLDDYFDDQTPSFSVSAAFFDVVTNEETEETVFKLNSAYDPVTFLSDLIPLSFFADPSTVLSGSIEYDDGTVEDVSPTISGNTENVVVTFSMLYMGVYVLPISITLTNIGTTVYPFTANSEYQIPTTWEELFYDSYATINENLSTVGNAHNENAVLENVPFYFDPLNSWGEDTLTMNYGAFTIYALIDNENDILTFYEAYVALLEDEGWEEVTSEETGIYIYENATFGLKITLTLYLDAVELTVTNVGFTYSNMFSDYSGSGYTPDVSHEELVNFPLLMPATGILNWGVVSSDNWETCQHFIQIGQTDTYISSIAAGVDDANSEFQAFLEEEGWTLKINTDPTYEDISEYVYSKVVGDRTYTITITYLFFGGDTVDIAVVLSGYDTPTSTDTPSEETPVE